MRRIYSIFLISFFAVASMFAKDASVTVEVLGDSKQNTEVKSAGVLDGKSNELQRKSSYALGTAPLPFTEVNNSHYNIAVSTGYYLVDNFDQDAADYWRPSETIYSRNEDPDLWFNIIAGPRIVDSNYWRDNTEEGKRFFRNPAYPTNGNSYFEFNNLFQDTVDNALAGPMPLKVNGGFYFNGIRYDSFYVTTNGLIALTNRRYFYDEFGNKYIPPGETTAYDPNSMDRFVTFVNGEDRRRVGDGLADNTPDDFGFKYSVLGGNPENPTSGIRSTLGYRQSTALHNITSRNYKPALIGFMHGNNRLSQFSSTTQRVDNHGRVSYRRTINNDRVIIYFENLVPSGSKFYPNVRINYPTPNDMRPGDNGYTAVSGQTILNRNDSSITIVYERFMGGVRNGNQLIPARDIFRANSTAGVYGFGRHANYNVTGGPDENDDEFPWVSEYEQYTYYFSDFAAPANFPATFSSVKFKQHQNTLRVVDIQYRVRKQDPNANLDFSEEVKSQDVNNYELLAGNDHLGAIQPVAIIQNVSNDLQSPTGVNFVPQDLNFYARFRVQNQATGRIVYNRAVPVDHRCLATPDSSLQDCEGNPDVRVRLVNVTIDDKGNYVAEVANYPGTNSWNGKVRDGLPPYGYVQVKFPPFEPNEFAKDENNKLYQIGRMAAYVIADATNPNNGKKLGDRWPFDDTAGVNLHVMKLHRFFSDDVREFHVIGNATIPSVQKWVSIDAEVINGDANSRHPLAPRGRYAADNNENLVLSSPVIKMNRKSITGQDNSPGDELRSHPIDMRGRYGSVISLSVQRTLDKEFWDRGYGDGLLVGPEPRSILNFDPFNNYRGAGSVAANPDMLKVEIMLPSDDGVSNITNVKDNRWSNHPRRGGLDPETKVPALGIYGAGGYVIGFLESDPDSSLAEPNAGTREMNSLRSDIYDDGIDFVYKKYFVPIPDTFIRWQNAGAKHFRFRIKMDASDDKKCGPCIPDDDDNFLVDNINVLFDTGETTDIEISAITFDWPYTEAPATQASSIPIEVTATNNTKNNAPFYYILVKIFRGTDTGPNGSLVYCRTLPITSHEGNDEIVRNPPNFPARDFGEGLYRAQAIIVVEGGDLEELNDTTYTDFEIKFGPTFAYDPVDSPVNNISGGTFPEGRGLNLRGYAYGGTTAGARSYNEAEHGAGYIGGSISGQVAMKFELLQKDTIYGYDAFFGTINQAPDAIALSIYNGDKDINIPQGVISESIIDRQRGRDDRDDKLKYGEYVRYILPKNQRQILEPGVYWMSIAQLGETGLELAGSSQRAGLRTLNVYIPPAQPIVGESGISLNIHKEFRKRNRNGNLVNNSYFALENTRGSGNWSAFTPGIGNVGYAHLHHFGGGVDAATSTLTNGTWIPMIRPYLGNKSSGSKSNELIDDCDVPIELVDFKGDQRKKAIDLDWITATEENNKGFYIEKRMKLDQGNTEWEQISFVNGNGNTKSTSYYDYSDENVVPGTTYQYQLRQVDFDGTQTCFDSKIVEINFTGAVTLTNYPNPVKDQTNFKYSLEKNSKVTLEIIDLLGNVVNTVLSNVEQSAGIQTKTYDVTDAIGNKLRTGTYIYKLTVDGKSQSAKMNVVK